MLKMKSLDGYLSLLLVLLLVNTCSGNTGDKTVVVFQDGKTEVQYTDSSGKKTTEKPSAFNALSFVAGLINNKEFLAVISLGRVQTSSKDYTDGVVTTRYGNNKKWTKAEMFYKVSQKSKPQTSWGDTTAVMKGDKIYVLITSTGGGKSGNTLRDPLMIVGTVTNPEADKSDSVNIKWEATSKAKNKLQENVGATGASKFIGGEGNGIVTTKGKIIFPIVIINENKKMASTLYSDDDGKKWLIGGETESGTGDGSLVEWNEEKLLFTVASQDGLWKVFESDNFGMTWKQSPILFGVWGNSAKQNGKETPGSVIAIPVREKNVLLFVYPENKGDKNNNLNTLKLWLSDGQRIMCVRTISDEKTEENTGHSLLVYVKENLYITYQINPSGLSDGKPEQTKDKWDKVIGFTPLPDVLEKLKTTVLAWSKLDELYNTKGIPVKGLVGFLGSTKTGNNVWADMYNCVSATVIGGTSVSGGFQFNGAAGSGAKWPVKSQGQTQVYKFTENQFTLAATVTIHRTIKDGDFSLIGASGNDHGSQVLVGLGYTKDMKWYTTPKSDKNIDTDVFVELGKEYHVTITLDNKIVSVYVNDREIAKETITIKEALSISHFFMGGTGVSSAAENDKLCTVKNVMLFSRGLTKDEITKLTNVKDINEMEEQTTKANEGDVPDNHTLHSRVAPSRDTEGPKVTPNTQPIIAPSNRKTGSKNKSTSTTENIKSIPTTEPQEASVITPEKATNERDQNKKINNALHGKGDAVLKKDAKGDNGAAVSLPAVVWMCFVCSLIALMGF